MNWKIITTACGVLCWSAVAQADIKYTQTTTMTAGGTSQKTSMLHAVKPNLERSESHIPIGTYDMENLSIRQCEQKQTVMLDSKLKIYTVMSDADVTAQATEATAVDDDDDAGGDEPKTGKIISTYIVKDLGEDTVAGFNTHHYSINTVMQMSGCAGTGVHNSTQEVWVSDIRDANPCADDATTPTTVAPVTAGGCKIEVVTKGDTDKLTEIYRGLILRTKMFQDGKLLMTTEVTSLSQAELGDELFTIPDGYKKVMPEEFQKQRNEAMVKAMTGGATTTAGDDGDAGANDGDGETPQKPEDIKKVLEDLLKDE